MGCWTRFSFWRVGFLNTRTHFLKLYSIFFSLSPSMYVNVYRSVIYIYIHILHVRTHIIYTQMAIPKKWLNSRKSLNLGETSSNCHPLSTFLIFSIYLSIDLSIYISIYVYHISFPVPIYIIEGHLESQTSDLWKDAATVLSQRSERVRRERVSRKKISRKKMQVRAKVEKSRSIVFFQCFVAPEGRKGGSLKGRKGGSLKRRVRIDR